MSEQLENNKRLYDKIKNPLRKAKLSWAKIINQMSKKVIEAIKEKLTEEEDNEIVLDSIEIPEINDEIKKNLEGINGLVSLALNSCGLNTLKNFPHIPELIRLELMNNNFKGNELHHLSHLKKIESISLSENEICTFDELSALGGLSQLVQLDLSSTPLAKDPEYRSRIFKMFPNLKILDNKDKLGNPYEYSDNDEDEYKEDDMSDDGEEDEEDENEEEGSENEDEEEEDGDEEGEESEEDEDDEDEEEESDEDEPKNNGKKSGRTKK